MFDSIFNFVADILSFFYALVPNYAIAIVLMTMLVMIVTTPLTLKGTKSMIKMQMLQPELKKIQDKYKKDGGDRMEMNAEVQAFMMENEMNPLGCAVPLLVQMPVFLLLFRLIEGLTRNGEDGTFDPKYLNASSDLYQALDREDEMVSFGIDLAQSTTSALGDSIVTGLPYLVLILIMIGSQYLQQKQVSARNPNQAAAMPQQQILLKVMPAFFGVISLNFAAALVVYWVTSSVYRIGLQAYITRALYGDEESIGAQANKAAAKAREDRSSAKGGNTAGEASNGATEAGDRPAAPAPRSKPGGNSRTTPPGGKHHPSSKKKKNKRRRR